MGSYQTTSFKKTTNSRTAANYCSYFEHSSAGVNEWLENSSGADLTVTGWYSGAITSKFGYLTADTASEYNGKSVHAILKTDSGTWSSCGVSGTMDADY